MKKLFNLLLSFLLITPLIGVLSVSNVKAEANYSYACSYNEYEVDYINDDGSFSSCGCYSDLASAKAKMHEAGEDYVVRHASSLSPTKIVAMNSGLVYTYPGRSGSNTMNIYQNASTRNQYYKQTYVASHYEMRYIDTERYLPNYNGGIVEVELNGFKGYADLEYTDLVPDKFLDKGIGLYLGGNNTYNGEEAFYVIPKRNYFEVVQNGAYFDLAFTYSRAYPENGNCPQSYTIYLGKAPDFMTSGVKYYSSDGVNFYTDTKQTNYVGTYYNYYQFLPLRTKTNISAEVLETFLKSVNSNSILIGHCSDFINEQETYGVNALLLFAMACQESAYGTSGYAKTRNNLFGWKAYDSDPNNASYFNSISDCINEQAGINLRGYIDITDGRFYSSSLGNKGSGVNVKYASDPYWGMKIASIAYKIDKVSKNKDGSYTDLNNYTLAKINSFDVSIKALANDSSSTLYTTQYGPYYQQDFIVSVLEQGSDYTKIQSTNGIDDNGNLITHRTPATTGTLNPISTYNFTKSVAYIKDSYLDYLNVERTTEIVDTADSVLTLMSAIDELNLNNNQININGCAFIKGISHNQLSKIKHKIILRNIADNSIYKSYTATTSEYDGIKFNDNHTYTYVGYQVSIPLSDIASGNYYLCIEVDNGTYSLENKLLNYDDSTSELCSYLNNTLYHLKANMIYGNRLELDVESMPSVLNYQTINKPSTRESMFSFDEFNLDENGNLSIFGQALIYYCNYDKQDNIHYILYLVDDADNYLEINCETLKANFDYQKLLNSSYNMDYICFKAKANISDLKVGSYKLILKIVNGHNIDYFELRNPANLDLPSNNVNNKTYRFYTSAIRDRLILEVK